MTNPLPGMNRFGTSPVRPSYWGFMSVDMQADLEAVSSFISVANYPNPMDALEAELTKIHSQAQHKSFLIEVEALEGDTAQALIAA